MEFAYNNSYHASIQMTPYEALYGRPCRSPFCWMEVGERPSTGSDLVRDTSENVDLILKHLLMAQSRQKSNSNKRRRPLEFEVGDHVFLKVTPKEGVVRFGKRGNLSLRYIGPFMRIGWLYCQVYPVFMQYSMSPYSGSTPQIRLMWWIRESLWLMQMRPSRRDQCVLWIVGIRFCKAILWG